MTGGVSRFTGHGQYPLACGGYTSRNPEFVCIFQYGFMKIEGHIYCGKRLCSCRYITEKSEIIIEKYGDITSLKKLIAVTLLRLQRICQRKFSVLRIIYKFRTDVIYGRMFEFQLFMRDGDFSL